MKKTFLKIISVLFFLFTQYNAIGQLGWIQQASFPGTARDYDAGFSIGHYGFIGCGHDASNNFHNDFYKWNQMTNAWSPITSYPGAGYEYSPIAFAIEGKGYVGLGWEGSYGATDLWRYDTTTNTWTQMATFPGRGRYDGNWFVIGHKAYIINGSAGGPPYIDDAWVYDAHANTWKQLSTPPMGQVDGGASFAIGNHGYYVGGWDGVMQTAGYKYDTAADTWTSIASIPNYDPGVAGDSRTWVIGSKAYVFNGHNSINHTFTQGWVYDTVTKSWCEFTDMGKLQRTYAAAFVVNNKLYMGTGMDSIGTYHADYWQYQPFSDIHVSDTTSACGAAGDSVHFSDSTSFYTSAIWSWYFPGGTPSSSALKNPAVYYSVSGTYPVTLILNACAGIDTITRAITITIGSSPTITTLVTANETCNGDCAGSVSTTVTGGALPYIYFWAPSGGSSAVASGLCAGIYTLTVTDRGGCTSTATVSITQPAAPITATMKATNAICNGGTGNAMVTPTAGVSPYTYLWTPSRQTTATATGLSAGSYNVNITDRNGCTATATVSITQPPPITATTTVNNVTCNGGTGSATVTPMAGVSPYTYLWTPSLQSTATVTGLNAGNYTIKITDLNGCTASTTVSITQPTLLTATISTTNNVLCYGGTGSATVIAGGGTSPYIYSWANSGGTNATGTGLTVGAYTVTVSDHNGCSATATTTITQPAVLTTNTTTMHSYCNLPNGSATAMVSGGTSPYVYLWTPSAQTLATATGLGVGTYSVTVTDKNHCTASTTASITQPITTTATITNVKNVSCNGSNDGAITVTASGGINPYTYLWMPGGNTTASATGLFAVSYTVAVADADGCIATATATLTQPPILTVTINEPEIICKDSTGILLANTAGGTGPYKYAWSAGITSTTDKATVTPISTRDFSLTVTDINGCTASGQIVLQYGPSFAVAIGGKKSVCTGDSAIICANTIGAIDGVTYLWEPENNTDACITVAPSTASVYTVTVIDGCGSTTTASTTIYTNPTPVVDMYADFYQGCVPLCVQFQNHSTILQGGIRQYVWAFGNGDTLAAKNPVYCYKSSGEYDVSLTVVSDSGCSATLNKLSMITVYTPPKAAFTYSPQPLNILEPTVQFMDESSDAYGIAYYWWAFGDGTNPISNLQNPTYTYKDTGIYCPQLIVMNDRGCFDTATNCLFVEHLYTLYIPSAFSPNGDGLNDVFEAKGTYIKSFEMYVFDRWGMELFHSTNINQGWNGTVKGTISQEDSYVYKVTVTDWNDTPHSYVGEVTLIK